MRIFKVRVSSHVTILQEEVISVGAIDEKDAHEMAKDAFGQIMDEKHGWCDYDDVHIEECVEC
jgi:hypothetical protein